MLVWAGWDMAKSLILNPVIYRETQQEAAVCVGNLWYPTLLSSARARNANELQRLHCILEPRIPRMYPLGTYFYQK